MAKASKRGAKDAARPDRWLPDTATPLAEHRLEGLEPDNLLAFMALLGLLRALEEARPDWRPRAFWDVDRHPWRPVLRLADARTQAEVAEAAAEGARSLGATLENVCRLASELEVRWARDELKRLEGKGDALSKDESQSIEKTAGRVSQPRDLSNVTIIASHAEALCEQYGVQNAVQETWVSCLAGFEFSPTGELSAAVTPLRFTSGQQAFAGLLYSLTASADASAIARSLFRPWLYQHRGDSFRFSPMEARRYAYMAIDPTNRKSAMKGGTGDGTAPSELGANVLATLAFLSFPVFLSPNGVAMPGFSDTSGSRVFRWPIWTSRFRRGATLSGIGAAIRQAEMEGSAVPSEVVGWFSATVFKLNPTKEYRNVNPARFMTKKPPDRRHNRP
jgi:hypothetical protein